MRLMLVLAGLAATAGAASAATTEAPAPLTTPSVAAILPATQALFDRYVGQGRAPGLAAAFGFRDLPPLFVGSGRIADGPAVPSADADSLWRIYSMTKPVTAVAVMMLIDEGKLKLDEPVSDVLPEFRSMRVLTDPDRSLASRAATRPITIRNLLTHTAGFGYTVVTRGPLLKAYDQAGITPGALSPAIEAAVRPNRPASLAGFSQRLARLPLIADPGSKWSYSVAFDLLGRVVEVASGQPFDRFLRDRIFVPLGMNSTGFTVSAADLPRLAASYAWLDGNRAPLDPAGAGSIFATPPSFPYGGAGLVSSARDYDRFLHMLQDGGTLAGVRILKPETAALMMSNLLPPGVTFPNVPGMGFGAGGMVRLTDDPGGLHKGSYAWGGAAGTFAWVDVAGRARGTVMVNWIPEEAWPLRADLAAALRADLMRLRR